MLGKIHGVCRRRPPAASARSCGIGARGGQPPEDRKPGTRRTLARRIGASLLARPSAVETPASARPHTDRAPCLRAGVWRNRPVAAPCPRGHRPLSSGDRAAGTHDPPQRRACRCLWHWRCRCIAALRRPRELTHGAASAWPPLAPGVTDRPARTRQRLRAWLPAARREHSRRGTVVHPGWGDVAEVLARTQEQAIDHTRATGQASVDYIAAVTRMARKSKQLSARFWRASRQTSCQFGGAPSRLSPIFEARLACLCRTRRPSKWASSSRPATTLAYWALGSR